MDRPNISKADIPEDASISEPSVAPSDDWVHELIAMTRPGIDFSLASRESWERQVPFEFDDFS